MNKELLAIYQRDLIYASLDDLSPASSLKEVVGGKSDDERFEQRCGEVVNFLCLSLRGGLIHFPDHPELSLPGGEGMLRRLLEDENDDLSVSWYTLYFEGTAELRVALASFGLLSWAAWNGGAHQRFIRWMVSRMSVRRVREG